jgi:3-deoxy-manno-octulosonate cytidylyltransferase (CMP-KDO synthetase)
MKAIGIIPARMASSRFPNKPLALIHGVPMVGHCWFRSKMSKSLDEVYIATCDQAVMDYARSINAPCIMTKDTHERASDRAAEAMLKIEAAGAKKSDVVVMIQGDEPMLLPEMMDLALGPLAEDPKVQISNLMAEMETAEEFEDPNEVKVVVDPKGNALYFSREPIPSRKKGAKKVPMLKQVCIIPFRRDYLLKFNDMPQTPLEIIESVDMMRILESGGAVRMVMSKARTLSVDTPADLARVIEAMRTDKLMLKYGARVS